MTGDKAEGQASPGKARRRARTSLRMRNDVAGREGFCESRLFGLSKNGAKKLCTFACVAKALFFLPASLFCSFIALYHRSYCLRHSFLRAMLAALERGLTSGTDLCSSAFAAALDGADGEVSLRGEFHVPRGAAGARYRRPDDDAVYLCGHSLGLAPVRAAGAVAAEMNLWAARGVEGHFERGSAPGSGAWASAEDAVVSLLRAGAAMRRKRAREL